MRERETFLQFRLTPEAQCEIQFRGFVTQAAIIKLIQLLELSVDAYPAEILYETPEKESEQ